MWNMVDNFDVECPENGYVRYGGERWCEMWWGTVVRNVVDNFGVECSRERLREIWRRTVMLGCNA